MPLGEWVKMPVYPAPGFLPDPSFVRASEWLSDPPDGEPLAVVLGVPFSRLSLSKARCDLLPGALREALGSFSTYAGSVGVDLASHAVTDLGDLVLDGPIDSSLERIREAARELAGGPPVVFVGGDNSITALTFAGICGNDGGLIALDAHHDLRDYQASGLSNGSPVRVLIDEGLDGKRVWQIGIKDFSNSEPYSRFASERGINVVPMDDVLESGAGPQVEKALGDLKGASGIYGGIDIDVADRASAPGAPAAQPGGLPPREIARAAFLLGADPLVRAIDIVEVDPERDIGGVTVRLAALVLLSFLAGVTQRPR